MRSYIGLQLVAGFTVHNTKTAFFVGIYVQRRKSRRRRLNLLKLQFIIDKDNIGAFFHSQDLAKQEERYVRLSSEPEEPVEVAEAEEEAPEETPEEAPEETPEEPEEEPAEEPSQEPAQTGEGTAQNRETRFTESVRLRSEPSTEAEYLGTAYHKL
mgnify:CR=1 FL=1